MADRNQLKKAPQPAISDDDPFAELTRIMGFDPREPVTPRQPAAIEKLAALHAEEADLAIDLEKELMGDFADLNDDLPASPEDTVASQIAPEAARDLAEDDTSEDFDFVFDADISIPETAAEAPEPVVSLADELDGSFVAPDEREPAAPEASLTAHRDPDEEGREAFDVSEAPVAIADDMPAYDFDAGEQLATEEPVAEEPVLEEEPAAEEFSMPAEALEEQPFMAEEPAPRAAEVEAAFGDDAELQAAALDGEIEETVHEMAAEEPLLAEQPAADIPAHEEELLADEFGDAFATHPDDQLAAVAEEQPVVPEPEFHAVEDAGAELAEAVGEIEVAPGAGSEAEAFDDGDVVPLIPLSVARDYAEETTEPLQAETAEADDYDLEAELSALLGKNKTALVEAEAIEAGETASAEMLDEPAAIDASWTAGEAEHTDVEPELSASEAEPYFDEPALFVDEALATEDHAPEMAARDAGFHTEMERLQAEAPEPGQAPDEDDPLSEFVVEQELQAELAALDGDIDLGLDDLVLDDEPMIEQAPQAVEPAPVVVPFAVAASAAATAPVAPRAAPAPQAPLSDEEEDDPFAMLAAMVRAPQPIAPPSQPAAPAGMNFQQTRWSDAPMASESPVSTTEYQYQNRPSANRAPVGVPEIDTVDVPESAVALADDLDIPELAFEDDLPQTADFGDFEAELASAFNQPAQPAAEPVRDVPRQAYQHDYAPYHQPDAAQPGHYAGAEDASAAYAASPRHAAHADDRYDGFDSGVLAGNQPPEAYRAADDDDLAYDPELNEDMAIPAYREAARQPSGNRRGLMLAAIVGGIVLVGGIGAYALSGGGGVSGAPALVRADTDPVKIRPENPGGASVPNQDNKVFQTMNGTDTAAAPSQEKLISGAEEPVDVASRAAPRVVTPQPAEDAEAAEAAPLMADDEIAAVADDPVAAEIAAAPKGEERVAPSAEEPAVNNETVAVAPRRVRTMVVRADGTLVPSEDPAPAAGIPSEETTASALDPADPSQSLADPIAPESTGSLKPVAEAPAPAPVETAVAPAAAASQTAMPSSGPVAPSRPADQPVDVVGEVKPQQVAAASGAAAAGSWSMQIASQPSEAAAQASYQDLSRRYGSVIGDKGVNIVKAEIAGKGTYWRVRVPAASRNDAITLCESYKAAGGNCFVSK